MKTFTSTLPEELFENLDRIAGSLSIPKNKIIEKALRIYLDQLTRAAYVQSFRQAVNDRDILEIAEEGMADYLKNIGE